MPVFGDALTFIAGIMRVKFGIFVVLISIGKGARYAILLGILSATGKVLGIDAL
jgi:membrane protein YqaA with SNARE-associated domain